MEWSFVASSFHSLIASTRYIQTDKELYICIDRIDVETDLYLVILHRSHRRNTHNGKGMSAHTYKQKHAHTFIKSVQSFGLIGFKRFWIFFCIGLTLFCLICCVAYGERRRRRHRMKEIGFLSDFNLFNYVSVVCESKRFFLSFWYISECTD